MGTLVHTLGPLAPASAAAAEWLVASVLKSLILILCVALLLRLLPRLSAAARSGIWTVVLLMVLFLPLFSLRGSGAWQAGSGEGGMLHAGAAWSWAIVGLWVLLSTVRLLQLAASALRLRTIARSAVAVQAGAAVQALLCQSPRRVRLCVSEEVSRPSVAGFFRPAILLPAGLLEELSAPELEHVVRHEMEHLRRRDDWTNLLQKLSLAVFPLHPALFWLDRRLCMERELACDDGVLRATRARKAYAACLARLAEDSMMRRGLSLALGLLGRQRRSELSGRVHRILRTPAEAMGRVQVVAACALLLAAVGGGSVILARTPRLISFSPATPLPGLQQAAVAERASAPAGSASLLSHFAQGAGAVSATTVKAVMTPKPVRAVPAVAAVARRHRALRRVAFAGPQQPEISPYLVLTAWQQQTMTPRLTLAVAREQRVVQLSEDSQPTYAAVPVRGGWLLIQL